VPKLPLTGPKSGPKDLVQVWFSGDHSHVGGGYPEAECGLPKGAFQWMVCEAASHGLRFETDRLRDVLGLTSKNYLRANPNGKLHNSMTSFWPFFEFVPKRVYDPQSQIWPWRINLFRRRQVPPDGLVHESAFLRTGYRPNFLATATIVQTSCPSSLGI
jgi:hypothetical protein